MKFVAIDTETTGLRMFHPRDRVIMISVCDGGTPTLHKVGSKYVRKILADPNICKLFYNAKFDVPMLMKEDHVVIRGPVWCLLIMAQMVYPEEHQHGLKWMARKVSKVKYEEMDRLKAWMGTGKNKRPMWEAPAHILGPYALRDAKETFDLWPPFYEGLKDKKMVSLYLTEMKVMRVVSKMEKRGLLVDRKRTAGLLKQCDKELKKLKIWLCDKTGDWKFNPNSPIQVAKHVYSGDTYCSRYTDKGKPSTDRVALLELDCDLARGVARFRELSKSASTYLRNFINGLDDEGIFRAAFNQAVAITGRFSSSGYGGQKFNLQNIPRPNERKGVLGRIRECIIARPFYRLFFFDMDQIEMRLNAHFTKDKDMIETILKGGDLHDLTCKRMFKLKKSSKKWKTMRYLAKTLNFLVIYGGRERRLQETVYDQTEGLLSISLEDCADHVQAYWDAHPALQTLFDKIANQVAKTGGVRNRYGRFSPVPANKSYVGVNYLIQGTAADYLKEAMLKCDHVLKGKKSNMLMTIHDELVFEIHYSERKLVPLLRDAMEDYTTFRVPLTASVEMASCWGKKKKVIVP
jgi:DNA polymerase-1